ncbi:MAG: hypothetical protein CMC07_08405 [Flavobacteriaceae bacterium]|nr:hypothetical protein [Flavobacteriaceae bacterium]|tara:strand:- start:3706 stop:4731 length:1026 start_codon:yes stop_codon:yes gene_type:complete
MVDLIKAKFNSQDIPNDIEENKYLEFTRPLSTKTGEIKKEAIAKYKGLTFSLDRYENLTIIGSIHKYSNCGRHNFNDFTFKDTIEVLKDISKKFNLDLSKGKLQNLELGVNITVPIKATKVVDNVLVHLAQKFKDYSIRGAEYRESTHSRYYLKAYNKSLQYRRKGYTINKEIFRWEIKYRKMYSLNQMGIYTLADLCDVKKIHLACNVLIDKWKGTLFYDPTLRLNEVSNYVRTTNIHQWQNPNWWLKLSKQNRKNLKDRMHKIFRESSDNLHDLILKKIEEKIKASFHNRVPMTHPIKSTNSLPFNTLYIGLNSQLTNTFAGVNACLYRKPKISERLCA